MQPDPRAPISQEQAWSEHQEHLARNEWGPWQWENDRFWVLYRDGAKRGVIGNEIYDCDMDLSAAYWLRHIGATKFRAFGPETIGWLVLGMAAKGHLK
jgi:hypothetical protein